MAEHPGLRQSIPPLVIGFILLAFTVTGLAAGVGARHLVDGLARSSPSPNSHAEQSASATRTASVQPTAAAQLSPSVEASETATTGAGYTGFTLSVSVSPAVVASGQQFTVTAVVVAHNHVSRLSGVPCTLVSLGSGAFPFTPAPPAKLSDAQGEVSWPLKATTASTGTYTLQVEGTGSLEYYYDVDVTVQVSG
ncbi:MAG: hypothetical protein ACLQUY_03970 [Ktedonobacterales bacterium]